MQPPDTDNGPPSLSESFQPRTGIGALRIPIVACLALAPLVCWSAGAAQGVHAGDPAATAFVQVNVLPLDRDGVLRDQTVLVEQGKIKAVGPRVPMQGK